MKQKKNQQKILGVNLISWAFSCFVGLLLGATEEREEYVPLSLPQKHGGRWESSNTG